ncbi:MAG: TIGR00730 family Rossman fold protein [Selenomonas sp.]|nr:TIGR00730 family Rossman fold protein [Selenomonas sp.]
MNVTVYLGSSEGNRPVFRQAVTELGTWLGRSGHTLIYGGSRVGLMGALAEAVIAAGGKVIGVEPRYFVDGQIQYDAIDQLIVTDTMAQRKTLMEEMADAFIVLPGGVGTFEEFFETLTLKLLGRHDKPIALLNTRGYYDAMYAAIRSSVAGGFTARSCLDMIALCADPEEALSAVEKTPSAHAARGISEYGR